MRKRMTFDLFQVMLVLGLASSLGLVLSGAALAADSQAQLASQIVEAAGLQGGLVVHVGCGDGKLAAALRRGDAYLVHGLDRDTENVQAAREHIQSVGQYGKVSVDRLSGNRLPYIDNLVNLIVASGDCRVAKEEMLRVLAPNGMAVFLNRQSEIEDGTLVKPRPQEIDDWTHYLYDPSNNAVSQDKVIGPLRNMQWMGSPRWSRHHDHMSSLSSLVSSNGRLFYIFDEGSTASIVLPSDWQLIGLPTTWTSSSTAWRNSSRITRKGSATATPSACVSPLVCASSPRGRRSRLRGTTPMPRWQLLWTA